MNDVINITEAGNYLQNLVKKAGKILQKYFNSGTFKQKQKAGVDFTTQADADVDKFLRDSLKEKYPMSNFLTEETAPSDYSSLSKTENMWVIDPLDGTINFSRKHSNFAISVALMDKGEIKLGIVYAPIENKLYYAQSDKEGAFLNDKKINVSNTSTLRETVVACDWAWDLKKRKNVIRWLDKLCGHIRQIKSMGSAASDLASLGGGKIDVYIHSGLKPWDVAAAGLIIKKAGGTISLPDGSEWSPFNPDILASNNILYKEILKLIH